MHEHVTSDSSSVNALLNRIRGLSDTHCRQRERCFWAEGIRNFVQAFDSRCTFDTVVYSPKLLSSDMAEMLTRRLVRSGVRRVRVTPEQFRSISTTDRASGIGAIIRQRWIPLEQLDHQRGLSFLIIEEIRSPGNLGTILRTAHACDIGGIIFVGSKSDPYDPAVVRASMGGLMHIPLIRTDVHKLRRWLCTHKVEVVGLSPDAKHLWNASLIGKPTALALGEERHGLSPALRGLCTQNVRLPMSNNVDSLNVAVAAGVMMYELVRRQLRT